MAAILGTPVLRKPDVSHAVTVSTGIRVSQPGWNDMKPGIDGALKVQLHGVCRAGSHDRLKLSGIAL